MVSKKSPSRTQKLFILDKDRPQHQIVLAFLDPLERGLQSALIIQLLSDFIGEQKEDPNFIAKKYLYGSHSEN
jgi:hypothetical protein